MYICSNWAGEKDLRRILKTEFVVKFDSVSILCVFNLQNCLTLSASKTEYVTLLEFLGDINWQQNGIALYWNRSVFTIVVEEVAKATAFGNRIKHKLTRCTEHANTRYYFVTFALNDERVWLEILATRTMEAYLRAKVAKRKDLAKSVQRLNLERTDVKKKCSQNGKRKLPARTSLSLVEMEKKKCRNWQFIL